MADSADDAQSTFSHAITLQDDNGKAEENASSSSQKVEEDSYDAETSKETPASSDPKKDDAGTPPSTSEPSDFGSFQVIYGPGAQCTVVSSLFGCKWSSTPHSLLPSKFLHSNNVITNYAITPHGDQLALYYGANDDVPGWTWQSACKPNSPTYQSLKSWLTGLLMSSPEDFRTARVIFGSGASYYAQCGERYLVHDLPARLHNAIEQYKQALEKARAIKAERDADPEGQRRLRLRLTNTDIRAIPGPLALKAGHLYLDNDEVRAPRLPDCVALGAQGTYVATWPGLCIAATTEPNTLWQELIKKAENITRVRYFSLSVFNTQHGFVLMKDWSYRVQFEQGTLDLAGCLKEHGQAWIKLKPGRVLAWEKLPVGDDVGGVMRLDQTTDFRAELRKPSGGSEDEKKRKEAEKEKEKHTKPRRLSRLFGRKEKEKTPSS